MKQLTDKQKKLDVDNDGAIESSDFKALRGGPKMSSTRFKGNGINAISAACKKAAKSKFKVWPSAYASGWRTMTAMGARTPPLCLRTKPLYNER